MAGERSSVRTNGGAPTDSAKLEDVTFRGSALTAFSVERIAAAGVDLRGCTTLGLTGIGRLDGFLASQDQLFALAPQLGDALGLTIEDPT